MSRPPNTDALLLLCLVEIVVSLSLDSGRTDSSEQKHGSSHDNKKVDVIDLTLDSSSEEELDDEPPPKRPCPSLSPQSPPATKG